MFAVNELMDISRELDETRARRAAAAEHVTRLKQQLVFLQRPSYSTQLMAQAFAGQTTESYRKLVAQAQVPVRIFGLCGSWPLVVRTRGVASQFLVISLKFRERELPVSFIAQLHRLNMEADLRSLFGLHVT